VGEPQEQELVHALYLDLGEIALSIEVPFVFDYSDSHRLCVHQFFFKAQSYIGQAAATVLMSTVLQKRTNAGGLSALGQ
jgi:hypothetical protein